MKKICGVDLVFSGLCKTIHSTVIIQRWMREEQFGFGSGAVLARPSIWRPRGARTEKRTALRGSENVHGELARPTQQCALGLERIDGVWSALISNRGGGEMRRVEPKAEIEPKRGLRFRHVSGCVRRGCEKGAYLKALRS